MGHRILILGILLTLVPTGAWALKGGGAGDAGGGHGFSSTPEAVRDYLKKADSKGSLFTHDWMDVYQRLDAWDALTPQYAPNGTVRRVLRALKKAYGHKDIYGYMESTPIVASKACYDGNGAVSDGSTEHKLGAPICMSVNRLARYPSESLKTEIIALAFHEWTHQLGFGETEAVEMQNYIKSLLPVTFAMLDEPSGEIPMRIGGFRTLTAQDGKSVTVYCYTNRLFRNMPDGGKVVHDASVVVFAGQAIAFRGQDFGAEKVACGNLPALDCRVEASKDSYCDGGYVYVGTWPRPDCASDPQARLQDLKNQGVCK